MQVIKEVYIIDCRSFFYHILMCHPHYQIQPCVVYNFPDVFGAVLRGSEPIQEPARLHRIHRGNVQRQETPRNATSHLRHIRGRVSQHVARYSSLSLTSYP